MSPGPAPAERGEYDRVEMDHLVVDEEAVDASPTGRVVQPASLLARTTDVFLRPSVPLVSLLALVLGFMLGVSLVRVALPSPTPTMPIGSSSFHPTMAVPSTSCPNVSASMPSAPGETMRVQTSYVQQAVASIGVAGPTTRADGTVVQCDCTKSEASERGDCASVCVFYFFVPILHMTEQNSRVHLKYGITEWDQVRGFLARHPEIATLDNRDTISPNWFQQPGELGYYNSLNLATRKRQGELMTQYLGGGFIYHIFWWFDEPLFAEFFRLLLADGYPSVPFFFNWVTENWRDGHHSSGRVKDGDDAADGIIWNFKLCLPEYEPSREQFWAWLVPFLRDPRYFRVRNRPVLSAYGWPDCPSLYPRLQEYAKRDAAINGFESLFFVNSLNHMPFHHGNVEPDALIEFQPNYATSGANWGERDVPAQKVHAPALAKYQWRGVVVNWDNRPRQEAGYLSKAGRYSDIHPHSYEVQLRGVFQETRRATYADGIANIVAVNAWNEWSEGVIMEPTLQFGTRYLQKVRQAMLADIYSGVVSVMLPVSLRWPIATVRKAILEILYSLDEALARTPEAPRWAAQSASVATQPRAPTPYFDQAAGGYRVLRTAAPAPLLFDYELVVVLHESPINERPMKPLLHWMRSINHPSLRYLDTQYLAMADFDAAVEASRLAFPHPLTPQPLKQASFRQAFNQTSDVKFPDWLFVLPMDALVDVVTDAHAGAFSLAHPPNPLVNSYVASTAGVDRASAARSVFASLARLPELLRGRLDEEKLTEVTLDLFGEKAIPGGSKLYRWDPLEIRVHKDAQPVTHVQHVAPNDDAPQPASPAPSATGPTPPA